MKTTILLVDDHPITRKGIRAMLKIDKSLEVIDEAIDGQDAINKAIEAKPEIIIMDISMPNMSGIEATSEIMKILPSTKIIALSIHAGQQFVQEMLDAGASGYLLKDEVPEDIIKAVKSVKLGNMYLSSGVTREALDKRKNEEEEFHISILKTKLYKPEISKDYVLRYNIIDQLEKNISKPLTLVSAPAGYGKSLLISSWLEKNKRPFSWISLSEDENDFRCFLSYVFEGIRMIFPNSLANIETFFKSSELPPLKVVEETLINELDEIQEEYVLVLDDYHLIHSQEINNLLIALLRFPPQMLQIVIITRRDPSINISSLRLNNRMNEIRMEELKFSEVEIAQLYKNILHKDLLSKTVKTLLNTTEGWVTGLRMASFLVGEEDDADPILNKLDGSFHFLTEYLVTEVLNKQPKEYKELLLVTSILDRFNANLIDEICESQCLEEKTNVKGKDFWEWLVDSNLFIISLDTNNKWFRYHHLFQELLYNELIKLYSKPKIKSILLKVSHWFEKEHLLDEAIHYARVALDVTREVEIIETYGRDFMNKDQWYIVAKWISNVSNSVIEQSPELLLLKAWKHFFHLELQELTPVLDKVDELMGGDANNHKLSGEVGFFRAYCAIFTNDSASGLKYLEISLRKIPISDVEFRGESEVLYGIAIQATGAAEEGISNLTKWINKGDLHPTREMRLLLTLAFVYYISGNVKMGAFYIKKHRVVSESNKAYSSVAWDDFLTGLFSLQQGKIELAITFFEKASRHKYVHYPMAAVDNLVALVVAYQINQQEDNASETLKILDEFTESLGGFYPLIADSCRARLSLMQGNIEEATQWLGRTEPNFNEVMIWWFNSLSITRCRVLIAEGSKMNLKLAERELENYVELNKTNHNSLQLINIFILQSIVYSKLGNSSKGLKKLKIAIDLAKPGNFIFPFLELGAPMLILLNNLPEEIVKQDFVAQIKRSFEQQKTTLEAAESKKPVEVYTTEEEFTIREVEVLKLVAVGLRNKEIAEKLFVCENTIKKHLYRMFQKLNVKNRMGLVKKGVLLGMIQRDTIN